MGLPILKSILKMFPENPFVVVSRDPEKLEGKYAHLAKNLKFRRANSITVEAEDTIIFAVPPQKASPNANYFSKNIKNLFLLK